MFNPLDHPVCLEFPAWREETAWAGHAPFAMYCVSAFRPRILVELGTHRGFSYSAFCQAVKATKAETKCFAVDTWEGDDHSGAYGDQVLEKLRSHHDPRYASFSQLVRATFDEASDQFENGSIDLLHIDGYHTYDAVKHDFETWLDKLSDRAIVLFHDTEVRDQDFGVWRFWAELKRRYPSIEFHQSHGLGVLGVGNRLTETAASLFTATDDEINVFKAFFSALGRSVEAELEATRLRERVHQLELFHDEVMASRSMRILKKIQDDGVVGYVKSHPRLHAPTKE